MRRSGEVRLELFAAMAAGTLTGLLSIVPYALNRYAYYEGDAADQIVPALQIIGRGLREGHWLVFEPAAWSGGNFAAEALFGLLNPVSLAVAVLVSYFDNLARAAAVISGIYLVLLSTGSYLLARTYGARRWPAVVVATAIPFTGFALWFGAGGWQYHLAAFAWVAWYWASLEQCRRLRVPVVMPFVFGALAMTVGSPFGALATALVSVATLAPPLWRREFATSWRAVVAAACVAVVALPVFGPLVGVSSVTSRSTVAALSNDTFLTPDLGDVVGGAFASYLPTINAWSGPIMLFPCTYFMWFVVPLAPWLKWRALRVRAQSLTPVFVMAILSAACMLAPSNLWLFRWGLRMQDYLYLSLGVLVAVVLSEGLERDQLRRRSLVGAGLLLASFYLAWAAQPSRWSVHVATFIGVLALAAIAVWQYRRAGIAALSLVLIVGTSAVVVDQKLAFRAVDDWGPMSVSMLKARASRYEGTVMQFASIRNGNDVLARQTRNGAFMMGYVPLAVGFESIGSYSGIAFDSLAVALCQDYRGTSCPEALDRSFAPVDDDTDVPMVDALGVSTIVLQRGNFDRARLVATPAGWHVAQRTSERVVWVRDDRLPVSRGRVTWTSAGVRVASADSSPRRETIDYDATRRGRILFSRLAWPGYGATVDGKPIGVDRDDVGLASVHVPAGHHQLVLEYHVPGWRLGIPAALTAALVSVLLSVQWLFGRNRRQRSLRRQTSAGAA